MIRILRGTVAICGLLLLVVMLGSAAPPTPSHAVTTGGWATWQPLTGSAGRWTTSMQLPASGFPAATVRSDSRAGQMGVESGASTWLSGATPPGAIFGSSRDNSYILLRPKAENATSPSTTTYTFERPTPPGGWAFVLGDIDADRAVVSARGDQGQAVALSELGWQGGFNYCAAALGPGCPGTAGNTAVWNPATGEVTGNSGGLDSSGASGWFRPSVPLTSLTITFFREGGLPAYQTWFASLGRDISGNVQLVDAAGLPTGVPIPGATLTLFGADGAPLATAISGASGEYAFLGYTAAGGYRVELTSVPDAGYPNGLLPYGSSSVSNIDIGAADASGVDLRVREVLPVSVSGTVATSSGLPVAGATVTLTGPGGPFTVMTASNGSYTLDGVGGGSYTFAITPPPGYSALAVPPVLTIPGGSELPVSNQDFTLEAPPSVSGTVSTATELISGVVVTLLDSSGTPVATSSSLGDGSYVFDLVPPGTYTVTIQAPPGYLSADSTTRDTTVTNIDVSGVNFSLVRSGTIGGSVSDSGGAAIPGVDINITGPQTAPTPPSNTVVTNSDGKYQLSDLPPGEYVVGITTPGGLAAEIPERHVTLTADGEYLEGEDFVLRPVAPVPPPTPPIPPSHPTTLPATGGGEANSLAVSALLLTAMGALGVTARRRRPRNAALAPFH